MNRPILDLRVALIATTSALVLACSSKDDAASAKETGGQSTSAAVAGPAAAHCAGKAIVVATRAACRPADAGQEADAGANATKEEAHNHSDHHAGHDGGRDGGDEADGGDGGEAASDGYGPTQYGSEGDDDQCKYRVKWTSRPVTKDADVTFSIVATNRNDASPVAGAEPYAEIFLDSTRPAPNTPVQTTETSPGNYTIGPVRFDAPGKWTVRFHFSADCVDGPESPHGHVAFFVNVP